MDFFFLLAFAFVVLVLLGKKKKKGNYKPRSHYSKTDHFDGEPKQESHISLATRCSYKTQAIMNKPEFVIYKTLQRLLGREFNVFPQVALGEVLTSSDGHSAINAKRVDLLIVNSYGHAVAAVEFNGSGKNGHFQGNAIERDAVKYLALTDAGVKYIAVSTTDESYLRQELETAGFVLKPKKTA
ncbi:DUF2726 domain-containing protein (plasmid) [Vibrio scophthalmi]|uniref:DUF2726 domain-containing protein n=1 Tax=Vibrio scophthalmi TaxID=45658 RepID=UPI0008097856|nr:DUF2726 domain-containing protein [Vibrio scophthalmi]ANS88100.1 hypothetical protein VSVS12_04401 [Vibrio scophthalmi]